jgi:hypothetical protein
MREISEFEMMTVAGGMEQIQMKRHRDDSSVSSIPPYYISGGAVSSNGAGVSAGGSRKPPQTCVDTIKQTCSTSQITKMEFGFQGVRIDRSPGGCTVTTVNSCTSIRTNSGR